MLFENSFDLSQLNSEATNLDLLINSAEEFDISTRLHVQLRQERDSLAPIRLTLTIEKAFKIKF